MKVLESLDMKAEDGLLLSFKGAFNPRAAWESELVPFLQALEAHAGEWMPDVVEGKRRRKYSRAAVWKALMERQGERVTSIGFCRTKWPYLDLTLRLYSASQPPRLDVLLTVKPLSFFGDAERCLQFVEMVRAWVSRYPSIHAAVHSVADRGLADSPHFGRDMQTSIREGFDKVYETFWLNVFGPKLVESVGRERMLSTPAWRVEELPNGCVLLVTRPTVTDFASEEARLTQARVHCHLRPDLDFPTVLGTLRERSATLAPVQPRFHPDLVPLLSRVVDDVASYARQRKIAELNAWQPPEPEEWRPSGSALPADVEDPERACAHYRYLAEHLVALLHTKVPSSFEATPESLTDADFFFWHEEFPTSRPRENIDAHAVPAIGAYLGQVLVRNLGGRWIPREKLEEAQVLVGHRVWFPFVRARHYMRSRQALLDFSLTQLYRVAERHRP